MGEEFEKNCVARSQSNLRNKKGVLFFCGRSDYFRALLEYKNSEASTSGQERLSESVVEVFLNDVSPDVTEENVFSVLCLADVYLLSGLKRLCARIVTGLLDTENVVTVLKTARLFNLAKLEVDCCEFISKNLEKIIENKEFHSLILEDAASVRERQETDSIPVVDDIRFHLMRGVLPYNVSEGDDDEFVDCEGSLQMLDNLLLYLGIEC
ncbi:Ankyrin repeat and BTB/POZ domain-containing protein 1 [Acropora cervicornis]|uniref:Ankyrin repeat and BTB/POZ domain-containing protein 1 n=1 Tax=Acropora cervicornis TaxID=6130 RepID=A0AAD9UXU0_ACRCE|nr:Ankyrin repeat and BTB/POZ domain-containing protein 1 [Acropora cervicornis]